MLRNQTLQLAATRNLNNQCCTCQLLPLPAHFCEPARLPSNELLELADTLGLL